MARRPTSAADSTVLRARTRNGLARAAALGWGSVSVLTVAVLSGKEFFYVPLGLAFAGLGLFVWVIRARDQAEPTAATPVKKSQEAVTLLSSDILPLWAKQVDMAKEEGNEAVVALAQAFEELSKKSAEELATVRQAIAELTGKGGALPLLKESRQELDGLLHFMRAAEATKEAILAEVMRAGDLSELANEVKEMAMQSKLLSLNAAIEAARAGQAGQAFNVVVGEMRQLAIRSSDASQRISAQVTQLQSAVTSVVQMEEANRHSAVKPVEEAEQSINKVVGRVDLTVDHVADLSRRVEQLANGVKADISNSMVALQFQDRISQILDHTVENMNAVKGSLESCDSHDWTTATWRRQWSRRMSMPEELDTLKGQRRSKVQPQEITYF